MPGPGAVLVKTTGRQTFWPARVDPRAFFAPERTDWTAPEWSHAYRTPDTVETSMGEIRQDDYAAIVLVNPAPDSTPLELSATVVRDTPRQISLIAPDGRPVVGAWTQGMTSYRYDYEPPLRAATFPLTGLHPERIRRIEFVEEDRRLIGFLQARGDGDSP